MVVESVAIVSHWQDVAVRIDVSFVEEVMKSNNPEGGENVN